MKIFGLYYKLIYICNIFIAKMIIAMKKSLLIIIVMCQTLLAIAQTKISGTVKTAKETGIQGVSISITDSYDGTTTNTEGYFTFRTTNKGQATIVASSIGYLPYSQTLNLQGDSITLIITLKEDIQELEAAIVMAGSFEAGDKKRASTVLSSLDMLTTGASNADVTSAIRTLPGAQQVGEQEGLAVRGGSVYETKQFIDGTMVPKPYFSGPENIAQRSRFSPALFKGTVFSTGGYSALYGQALSSALILESIDLPIQSQANATLSTVFLGAGFQSLAKNKKSSWGIDLTYTNPEPYFKVVKQTYDINKTPQFYSGNANFRFKTKWGGMVKYYTSMDFDKMDISRENIDYEDYKNSFDMTTFNWYNNLSWKEYLGNSWKFDLGISYSHNSDKFNQTVKDGNGSIVTLPSPYLDSVYTFNTKAIQDFAQAKLVIEKKLGGLNALRFGAEQWYENVENTYSQYSKTLIDSYSAVFGEIDFHLSYRIAVKIGARGEYSSIIDKWNIAPRLSAAYKVSHKSQFSAAYGIFYQKPENLQMIYTTALSYQQAAHYILNYQYNNKHKTLRIEGFYKTYDDLVKTAPTYNNDGSGYARGVELYWRDKRAFGSWLDYWISYSYLDTKRDYLKYPEKMRPNFAAEHTLSVVAKKWIPAISSSVNLSYTFATGRPYFNLMHNTANNSYHIADWGRTKCYNDLGFSINYVTKILGSNAVVVASVTNLLGQKNIYGYSYSHDGSIKKPITPTADRFYFLGVFLSWGVDRSKDIIDGIY